MNIIDKDELEPPHPLVLLIIAIAGIIVSAVIIAYAPSWLTRPYDMGRLWDIAWMLAVAATVFITLFLPREEAGQP